MSILNIEADGDAVPLRFRGIPTGSVSNPGVPLVRDLEAAVSGEVRFDPGTRAIYSTDASNYRQIPIGVVIPESVGDVIATLEVARRHGVPITTRGGGTSLAGQACNTAVIIDFSKYMNRVISIDPDERTAVVEPGCVLDTLREAARAHGLDFGPDPATHDRNTLGGMIGNNSCGVRSVMSERYGPGPMTVHQVRTLDVITYRGERMTVGPVADDDLAAAIEGSDASARIHRELLELRDAYADEIRRRYPGNLRRASGYNLDWLLPERGFDVGRALVGSEGTCVVVLGATVELMEARPHRALVVVGYDDVATAAEHVPEIIEHGPVGLEGVDSKLVEFMTRKGMYPDELEMLPPAGAWLLVEFGAADRSGADSQANRLAAALGAGRGAPTVRVVTDPDRQDRLWKVREAGLGATAHVPGMDATHPGWEDAAVPPDRLPSYLRAFRSLLTEYGYSAALYGHLGQGCVHCRIDFDLSTVEGVDHFRSFLDRAADLVVRHGGSLSGEHGDGQARGRLLDKMYGSQIVGAFRRFKAIWDPDGMMNPGKLVDARSPIDDLRVGPGNRPRRVTTRFAFADDHGSFADATTRCVGVGACRDVRSGTMCPSYMATREEEHSTRGRARALYEMLQGDPIDSGWRSDEVLAALELCLACKACKNECPVNVDMATYKAEFAHHHFRHRIRPRVAYSMGLIHRWAPLASAVAAITNGVVQNRLLAAPLKALAGVAPERRIPRFANPSFRDWFSKRRSVVDGERVLLWPDTFTNYFDPEPAKAAVRVLESMGFHVDIPRRRLCCGRPLYDWGMLDTADRLWRRTFRALAEDIEAGTPIIGLEPSCVAAFRDELPGLFPDHGAAQALAANTSLLGEFLDHRGFTPPSVQGAALVQGHCHQRSVLDMDANMRVLAGTGLEAELLDSGCCGMAGAFGFDARHVDISLRIAERVLLPVVRSAPSETLIVADGFSCREQIRQDGRRNPLHLAEVLDMGIGRTGSTSTGRTAHG